VADFRTHLSVASRVSGLAATGLLVTGLAQVHEVLLYFIMGVMGGILPDIDADNSVAIRLVFNFLAPVIAFFLVFGQRIGTSLAELLLIWAAVFFMVKYPVFYLFTRLTVHRGIIHSVPAGILFWLLDAILLHRVFHVSNFTAWMAGFFVFLGFIIHLVLDELGSLDLSGRRVKKSFGTALKLRNPKDPKATSVLYITIIGLFFLAPDPEPFLATILSSEHYLNIHLFPQGQWFQGLINALQD